MTLAAFGSLLTFVVYDTKSVRLDELGWTDLSDSFDEMKLRARQRNFNFPYLYDGDSEAVARETRIHDNGRIEDERQRPSRARRTAATLLIIGAPFDIRRHALGNGSISGSPRTLSRSRSSTKCCT